MVPAQPPLPTAWNLPFHAWAGSQTSILMSESDEGVSVAATRQKVGSWLNCGTAGPVSGRVNAPAATVLAKVIEVFGSARDDKLSHDDAALRACPCVVSARRSAHDPPVTIFIARSSEVRRPECLHLINVCSLPIVEGVRIRSAEIDHACNTIGMVLCNRTHFCVGDGVPH